MSDNAKFLIDCETENGEMKNNAKENSEQENSIAQNRIIKKRAIILACILLSLIIPFICLAVNPDGAVFNFLNFTHVIITKPKIFGGFHLAWLFVALGFALTAIILRKKLSDKRVETILFASGVVMLVMEVYKQLYVYYVLSGGHYNFGVLPLQVCHYSLYCFLIIPLLKEGKIKRALTLFCALYQTVGGFIVLIYPTLYKELPLSLLTMSWHLIMIFNGINLLFKSCYKRAYLKDVFPACAVFLATFLLANLLNLLLSPHIKNSLQPLNLFYISPYIQSTYVIIGDVQRIFGWFPSIICYAILFIFGGANLVWGIGKIITKIAKDN